MKKRTKALLTFLAIFSIGFLIPEPRVIPVEKASSADWHKDTFWYEPWGSSGVHRGVDIFASKDKDVIASTHQFVLYRGEFSKGGNVLIALGPKWRIHYYAHLDTFDQDAGVFVKAGDSLGKVGDSGNAKGKAPHLHYSIISVVPYIWEIDSGTLGYLKAFYLNPIEFFTG